MGKTLVVKLGSESMGWLPSEKYYNDIKYKLIQSGVLKKFDGYIITHYGTNFEIIDTDKLKIESPENYFEIKNENDTDTKEIVTNGKYGTITITKYKNNEKYYFYSIYWDYALRCICSKCTKDKNKELKEYFSNILPIGSYIFNCDWEYKYIIMCPQELSDSYIKHINFNKESGQFCDIERFKKIADYKITKKDK